MCAKIADYNPLACPTGLSKYNKTRSCCQAFGHSIESTFCVSGLIWCGGSSNIDDFINVLPRQVWLPIYEFGRAMTYRTYEEPKNTRRKTEFGKVVYFAGRLVRDLFIGQRNGFENSKAGSALCVRNASDEMSCCDKLRKRNNDYCLNDLLSFIN